MVVFWVERERPRVGSIHAFALVCERDEGPHLDGDIQLGHCGCIPAHTQPYLRSSLGGTYVLRRQSHSRITLRRCSGVTGGTSGIQSEFSVLSAEADRCTSLASKTGSSPMFDAVRRPDNKGCDTSQYPLMLYSLSSSAREKVNGTTQRN